MANRPMRKLPWLTEPAIDFLRGYLHQNMRVLEFGSGASTVWISERVGSMVSFENNRAWARRVKLAAPDVDLRVRKMPFCPAIRQFRNGEFDFVLVDQGMGVLRDRIRCIRACLPKLKRGGVLMVDNTEQKALRDVPALKPYCVVHAHQRGPDAHGFPGRQRAGMVWMTSWWYIRSPRKG